MRKVTGNLRSNFRAFDKWLTLSVFLLLVIGTLLVYAATKQWFQTQGLDHNII